MNKRVIIVAADKRVCDVVQRYGIDFTLLEHPRHLKPYVMDRVEEAVLVDIEKEHELYLAMLAAAHKVRSFAAVLCPDEEFGLEPAARIAEALSIPATPTEVVHRTRNKVEMRQFLQGKNFSPVVYSVVRQASDLVKFAEANGFPFIVKPIAGVSSRGVVLVAKPNDLDLIEDLSGDCIAEEFLDGIQLSVEAFSFAGKHVIFGINLESNIAENELNPFVEVSHQMPAPIDMDQAEQVRAFTRDFLDCIEIKDGPSHTELKLTSKGIRVLEAHNRLGGDRLPDLVQLTTGFDLYELTVLWPLGMIEAPDRDPSPACGASVKFFTPRPGVVDRVYGIESCRRNVGVHDIYLPLKPGDTVSPVAYTGDRSGYIICVGDTSDIARDRCSEYIRGITIETS